MGLESQAVSCYRLPMQLWTLTTVLVDVVFDLGALALARLSVQSELELQMQQLCW